MKRAALFAIGCFCVACSDNRPSADHFGVAQSAMGYDFWLSTPASSPIFVNPFGAGQPAGSGNISMLLDPGNPFNCRECSFSRTGAAAGGQVSSATSTAAYASSLWNYGGADSLQSRFSGAVGPATSHFGASYATSLYSVVSNIDTWLKQWPGVNPNSVAKSTPSPTTWFRGFSPTQTRALVYGNGVYYHPAPYWLEEMRYRGARTYCALRETAKQQDSTLKYSMGAESGSSFIEWTLGASESTIGVGPSWKDTASPTASVYVVPLALGSRLAPLQGPLVPDPGNIVHPVSWITGDALLVSYESGGTKAYVNSQHADAFIGQRVAGSVTGSNLPLFSYAFIDVTGSFTFDAEFGTLLPTSGSWGTASSELTSGTGHFNSAPLRRTYEFDKLIAGHYRPSAVASDSPLQNDGLIYPVEDDGPVLYGMYDFAGIGTRIRANDDRALTIGDRVHENLGITYGGGFSFTSPVMTLTFGVSGTTSIDLVAYRLTTIREQVSAASGQKLLPFAGDLTPPNSGGANFTPQSNVLVVPETKREYSLNPLTVQGDVHITANLGFFSVDKHFAQTIFKLSAISLGSTANQIGPESHRLRVGEFTEVGASAAGWTPGFDYGDATQNSRSTFSHLPDPGVSSESSIPNYASFPDPGIDSIPACLSDPSSPGHLPHPTGGGPGTSPSMQACVYGPSCPASFHENGGRCTADTWGVPANICSPGGISSYLAGVGLQGTQYTCMSHVLNFYCDASVVPPPKVQQWANGGNVIARSVDVDAANAIQEECLEAFGSNASSQAEADAAAELVAALFHYALCDAGWNLQGQEAV